MTFTENPVRNGADTAPLSATLDAVKGDPGIAKFRSQATNTWVSGTHHRSSLYGLHLRLAAPQSPGVLHISSKSEAARAGTVEHESD